MDKRFDDRLATMQPSICDNEWVFHDIRQYYNSFAHEHQLIEWCESRVLAPTDSELYGFGCRLDGWDQDEPWLELPESIRADSIQGLEPRDDDVIFETAAYMNEAINYGVSRASTPSDVDGKGPVVG